MCRALVQSLAGDGYMCGDGVEMPDLNVVVLMIEKTDIRVHGILVAERTFRIV